jgi:Hemerythrin HHE cation binding domain
LPVCRRESISRPLVDECRFCPIALTAQPDLFSNVHKGIRRALFAACADLGRADGDAAREVTARATLAEALHFVGHHGENEDTLLLPILRERAPETFESMSRAHAALDAARAAIAKQQPIADLYLAACAFTSQYLAHMDDEERVFEPAIRAVLSADEAIAFGRRSVERTAPSDQRMMLGWMLPAMTRPDADAFLSRVPPALAAELRPLVDSTAPQ